MIRRLRPCNTGVGYVSSRNNYHCYRNINGFTVEVREQCHIRDLMGHISPKPIRTIIRFESLIFSNNCSNCLDNLTMRSYFEKFRLRAENDLTGDEERESFHGQWNVVDDHSLLLRLHSNVSSPYCTSRRRKPLRPPYSKVKLHSFRHYESSKAVYSV